MQDFMVQSVLVRDMSKRIRRRTKSTLSNVLLLDYVALTLLEMNLSSLIYPYL